MSEIKDRQDAVSDIDPIVAALADETANDAWAASAVEGSDQATEPTSGEAPALAVGPAEQPGETPHAAAPDDDPSDLAAEAVSIDAAPAVADIADAIEAALLAEPSAPGAATAFEHLPAAYADTVVELDEADDDAPLLDVDLEDGIASVFAALHAARDDATPAAPTGDLETADIVTFRLLGELDRLWHRAA